jgi:hypothetical protein
MKFNRQIIFIHFDNLQRPYYHIAIPEIGLNYMDFDYAAPDENCSYTICPLVTSTILAPENADDRIILEIDFGPGDTAAPVLVAKRVPGSIILKHKCAVQSNVKSGSLGEIFISYRHDFNRVIATCREYY